MIKIEHAIFVKDDSQKTKLKFRPIKRFETIEKLAKNLEKTIGKEKVDFSKVRVLVGIIINFEKAEDLQELNLKKEFDDTYAILKKEVTKYKLINLDDRFLEIRPLT